MALRSSSTVIARSAKIGCFVWFPRECSRCVKETESIYLPIQSLEVVLVVLVMVPVDSGVVVIPACSGEFRGHFSSSPATTYMRSRLAVDDLPGSRLVNVEVIFAIDFEIDFLRQLKVKSSDFVWETLSEDFHEVQTTSRKSRRLPGSPDDFQEVQTTSRKSRRLKWKSSDFLEVV
ncbi:hypothetical protein YC2023_008798 [Brassica napus]